MTLRNIRRVKEPATKAKRKSTGAKHGANKSRRRLHCDREPAAAVSDSDADPSSAATVAYDQYLTPVRNVTWDQVGSMSKLEEDILNEVSSFLYNVKFRQMFGYACKGMPWAGPPGVSKNIPLSAAINAVNSWIPDTIQKTVLISIDSSDIRKSYHGEGEKAIRKCTRHV